MIMIHLSIFCNETLSLLVHFMRMISSWDFHVSILSSMHFRLFTTKGHSQQMMSHPQLLATPSVVLHPVSFISTYLSDLLSHDVAKQPVIASTHLIKFRSSCYERTSVGEFTPLLVI